MTVAPPAPFAHAPEEAAPDAAAVPPSAMGPAPEVTETEAPASAAAEPPARLSLAELRRLLALEQAEQASAALAAPPAAHARSNESTTVDESFAEVPRPPWMNTSVGLAKKLWVHVPPDARPTLARHGYAAIVGVVCFLLGLWVRGLLVTWGQYNDPPDRPQ